MYLRVKLLLPNGMTRMVEICPEVRQEHTYFA